jgi:hypothetical protein
MRYNNATCVHRLFVRATAASVGVFAPQAKKSVQIRPIFLLPKSFFTQVGGKHILLPMALKCA